MKKYVLIMALLLGSGAQLSAITPEQLIANGKDTVTVNGVTLRKGTIAALIENVSQLDVLLMKGESREKAIIAISVLRDSIPAQKAVNLFEVFPAEDWILGEDRPGKIMVGVLYLQKYPENMSSTVKEQLKKMSHSAHPLLKLEIEKII